MRNLHDCFAEIPDPRRLQGRRYSMATFLSLMTLSYMSGQYSMQSMRRYFINNKKDLVDIFELKHGVPSYAGIRYFMEKLNFEQINTVFKDWALQFMNKSEKEWVHVDGKCLRSTVENCHSTHQSYISMVGLFVGEKGINLAYNHFDNGKSGECNQVITLLKELENQGCIITLDALHCKKKL